MSKNYKICKIKLFISDLLTYYLLSIIIQTCSLSSYFLDCLEKNMQMYINPDPKFLYHNNTADV